MMSSSETVFLVLGAVSLLAILSNYVFYPIAIAILARLFPRSWKIDDEFQPAVTMILAAYNEEAVIREKLRNFLSLDYPADRLFLLVGSDGSTDATNAILEEFADGERIRYFQFPRGGKPKTINSLFRHVTTPIAVLTDTNVMYRRDAVKRLVRHFVDPTVGGVCGYQRTTPIGDSIAGESEHRYWEFENALKRWEGTYATTLGAAGGMYAIRTELYQPQPEIGTVADDLLLPLRIVAHGSRIVYDETALSEEETSPNLKAEFRRKVRIAIATFNTIPQILALFKMLPLKVRVMLVFHKFLRWFVPLFMLVFLVSALALSSLRWIQLSVFVPLGVFGLFVVAGWIADRFEQRLGAFSMPYYFFTSNLALLVALLKLPFQKKTTGAWERSVRT